MNIIISFPYTVLISILIGYIFYNQSPFNLSLSLSLSILFLWFWINILRERERERETNRLLMLLKNIFLKKCHNNERRPDSSVWLFVSNSAIRIYIRKYISDGVLYTKTLSKFCLSFYTIAKNTFTTPTVISRKYRK